MVPLAASARPAGSEPVLLQVYGPIPVPAVVLRVRVKGLPVVNVRLFDGGVTIETCGRIVSISDCVVNAVNESVAVTVKFCVVAAAVGLPLMVPPGASARSDRFGNIHVRLAA